MARITDQYVVENLLKTIDAKVHQCIDKTLTVSHISCNNNKHADNDNVNATPNTNSQDHDQDPSVTRSINNSTKLNDLLKKKSKGLQSGDFIIPRGCIKVTEDKLTEILSLVQGELSDDAWCVSRVAQDRFSLLAIFLNRAAVFKNVLGEVESKGHRYGYRQSGERPLNVALRCGARGQGQGSAGSLSDLRCCLLLKHIKHLLKAHGHSAEIVDDVPQINQSSDSPESRIKTSALSLMSGDNGGSGLLAIDEDGDLALDAQKFIAEKGYHAGKDGFDKNLSKIKIVSNESLSNTTEEAVKLELSIQQNGLCQEMDGVVHVVPQCDAFRNQKLQLVSRALSERWQNQSQLVVGPVVTKSENTQGPDDQESLADRYQRLRLAQLTEAAKARYGEVTSGEEGRKQISDLTQASIVFDMLQNAQHTTLHLNLNSSGEGIDSRTGAFVMYNTARLATLWQHFTQGVNADSFPPLPPVGKCDFTLLREEEEWELMFLFISRYPEVVLHSVEEIFPQDGRIAAKIHTHKITKFLVEFSKHLSSYYSRYHIIGGVEHHLLPLMFARLHLMRAAHQVLVNAFHLLGVEPPAHL